ncbi:hypothetical protein EJB00_02595 [Wolbachia endosymbiont of Drosophila mauritiana]|uniref:hypothetical protein n=1 Tax=unclassified Wolbachia TaxID=2640676 RepID=UPI00107E8B7E|nr:MULTISPECIES: hypothetical protein [unclassified Wolbachia]QCB62518.1 hypothetical protein EJA99_02600 [Wolbachia endosymbiont of Drosophila mauritiana]QCB63564.1 hypothetical protein EJB00_02595 [Wolbachia endosymbiont of Drosophila mauritiana]QWE33161.1 Uncharacterized protein WwMa_02330 [Wolbachia endosymbiont of Drosophila simulans]TGB07562.1 hypothetical protein E5C28_00990 [Wolbachia endosymbiont of Drosophila mauritiana]
MHGSISDEVVKNLDKLASYRQVNKFKKIFNNLSTNHKNEYIRHVKAKPKSSKAMSGILNALDNQEAPSIFKELLQKDKEFAFNTLDCIHPKYTLFKTLFNQLNTQQKEDYKVNLETKSTVKAELILKNFYLSNKESSSNLSTENSNEPLVQNRDDLPAANFSPISPAFEETVVEHTFDTRLEFSSDKEDQSCSQTVIPFPGFAEFDNQFRNTVTENSTVSSSLTSNENISDSLEGEQLSPEYYNSLINGVTSLQSSIVDDLPELNLSPITPAFEETVVEHTFDSRSDFSYENEPLVHKRKRDDLNEFSEPSLENFLPSFATLEQIVAEREFDNGIDEISTVEPPAKRQCISVPPFEGFAEFHNQFCNIVPEDSIVNDSAVPEEHTSLEGELTFLYSQINVGEPLTSLQSSNVNPLPEFSFSLSSVTLDEMVKRYGFNHNDHAPSDLEAVVLKVNRKIDVAVNKYLKFVWAYLFTAMLLLYRNSFRAILLSKQSTVSY